VFEKIVQTTAKQTEKLPKFCWQFLFHHATHLLKIESKDCNSTEREATESKFN